MTLVAAGSEWLDEDEDGIPERTAFLDLRAEALDADSNGIVETASLTLRAEVVEDPDEDGTPEVRTWVSVDYHGEDLDQDGEMDNVSLVIEKLREENP